MYRSPGRIGGQALAAHAQLPCRSARGGNAHVDRAAGQFHRDDRAQRRLQGRDGQREQQVAAVGAKAPVRPELHFEQQVAGRPLPMPARLAGEADHLASRMPAGIFTLSVRSSSTT
jgi:hypothetical protein